MMVNCLPFLLVCHRMTITVAIDCMGGDHGPQVTVPAALEFVRDQPDVRVILVGLAESIALSRATRRSAWWPFVMPAKWSPWTSRRLGAAHQERLVDARGGQSGQAGRGGCLCFGREHRCADGHFPFRPQDAARYRSAGDLRRLPTLTGHTHVLDLGANVDCSPEHLLQFGIMGASLVSAIEHRDRPTVGILNIGEEEIKGNDVVKRAAELLWDSGLNFVGNVEGDGVYKGEADVIVCDGFVGNVALKASEGLAQLLATFLRQEFRRNLLTKLAAVIAMPVLNRFKKRVDHRQYNGATLLGLKGIVVKSHGSADAFAFGQCAAACREEAQQWRAGTDQRTRCATTTASGDRIACSPALPGSAVFCPVSRSATTISRVVASTPAMSGSSAEPASSPPSRRTARRQRSGPGGEPSGAKRGRSGGHRPRPDHRRHLDPGFHFPSTACLLQGKLGNHGATAFDVQAVCSGFVYALTIADKFIRSGSHRRALVVGRGLFAHSRLV
jgi:glycerol-3-phosphate acyltransferase PlsX